VQGEKGMAVVYATIEAAALMRGTSIEEALKDLSKAETLVQHGLTLYAMSLRSEAPMSRRL
jgi:hypothetical protein